LAARTVRNDLMDVQVMSVRFYQGWGDLTLKPAAQMTTEFAAMIGNGAAAVKSMPGADAFPDWPTSEGPKEVSGKP